MLHRTREPPNRLLIDAATLGEESAMPIEEINIGTQ